MQARSMVADTLLKCMECETRVVRLVPVKLLVRKVFDSVNFTLPPSELSKVRHGVGCGLLAVTQFPVSAQFQLSSLPMRGHDLPRPPSWPWTTDASRRSKDSNGYVLKTTFFNTRRLCTVQDPPTLCFSFRAQFPGQWATRA